MSDTTYHAVVHAVLTAAVALPALALGWWIDAWIERRRKR